MSGRGVAEQPNSSVSTALFDDGRTSGAVLDCITGDVVGLRPRHVATVDVRLLRTASDNELDHHRRQMFNEIFRKKVWGTDSSVDFSASGSYPAAK